MIGQTNPSLMLVGVDGSPSSIDALQEAATIAAALGARVEAITTWEYPLIASGYYPRYEWSPEEDASRVLADAVEQAFPDGPPAGLRQVVLQGAPARTLIAESRRADMLVLGSRGHGGFTGLLLGSVSAACAAHAHCPVLIMHSTTRPDAVDPADD